MIDQEDSKEKLLSELSSLRKLNSQLQQMASVAEKIESGIVITNSEGIIEWVNPAYIHMTAMDSSDLCGQLIQEVLFSKGSQESTQRSDQQKQLTQSLKRGIRCAFELPQTRADGKEYWAAIQCAPTEQSSDAMARWIFTCVDITKRHQVLAELQKSKEAAEAASRTKSEFLANMSHEIRTPMNAIIGMTELTLNTSLTPEQQDYLTTVKQSAEALLRLLNDILDLSKIEAGKLEIHQLEFTLDTLIHETMKSLDVQARAKSLSFNWEILPEVPVKLIGDSIRLRQVLVNLVGNAIKFTETGSVRLTVENQWQTDHEVGLHFAISDTGIGIPVEKLQSIFDGFTQAESGISRRYGGTGLGLAICSQIIELMAGRIWVHSEVGKGSTFHFSVKFTVQSKASTTECKSGESKVGESKFGESKSSVELSPITPVIAKHPSVKNIVKLSVLVADDNPANRNLASKILEKRGHVVREAIDGTEVLSLIADQSFDVILMDVQMPELDGFATTAAIRKQEEESFHRIPIIAMTAYSMKGDRERCIAAGMDDYLAKPIRQQELYDLVEQIAVSTAEGSSIDLKNPTALAERFAIPLGRLEGDLDLLKEQMQFFLKDSPTLLQEIQEAIHAKNGKQLQIAAHRLKGLVSDYDATEAVAIAFQLECQGQTEIFSEAMLGYRKLEMLLHKVRQEISAFLRNC